MDQNPIPAPTDQALTSVAPAPAPTPAPPANIPPPFTLPSSVTSIPSASSQATLGQTSTLNPESNSKKKWIKIGVIAFAAVVLTGVLLYFGKTYLFKGQVQEVLVDQRRVACESEPLKGFFKEEGSTCISDGNIYIWSVDKWELRPEAEVEVGPVLTHPEEIKELPAKDIRVSSCENAPPDGLSGVLDGDFCNVGSSQYSWNGSAWIILVPEEEKKIPEEGEGAIAPEEGKIPEGVEGEGELAKDPDGVCPGADYVWGPWSECTDGKQVRSGSNDACVPALIFQNQVCIVGSSSSAEIALAETPKPTEEPSPATPPASSEVGLGAGQGPGGPSGLDYGGTSVGSGGGSSASAPITGVGGGGTPTFIVGGGTESRPTEVSQAAGEVRGTTQEASQSGIVEESVSPGVSPDRVASTSGALHGAYIQGQTGPGILFYPFMLAGANALYFWRKKRKAKR